MSKIRTFFIIGILFLLCTGILGLAGIFMAIPSLLALSELFVIISMIFMLWGYVVTLEGIDRNVARNVELMESLVNTLEKGRRE